jgi:serine protease Do
MDEYRGYGNEKKNRSKSNRVLLIVLVVFLSLVLGFSTGVAGIGYFLSVNDIDVRSIFTGGQVEDNNGGNPENTDAGKEEIVKRVEIIESETASPVQAIAEKVIPSVVGVRITYPYTNYFFGFSNEGVGEGSGIIISEDGYIVTNNHVIENALVENTNRLYDSASVMIYLHGNTEKPYEAEIVGRDAVTDLALLKIGASNLPAVEIGDSSELEVGELAVAVGNPGGMMYMGSVTAGVISGLNREIYDSAAGVGNDEKLNLIQTDAAINPGNSGGALVNAEGKLIGINTLKIVSTGYEGLGFAIPVNKAMEIVDELRENGLVSRGKPNIGVSISTEYDKDAADEAGLPKGALIVRVGAFTPAEEAGLKVGDIITKINGAEIKSFEDLDAEKNKYTPGEEITLTVFRPDEAGDDGTYIDIPLVLGEANY